MSVRRRSLFVLLLVLGLIAGSIAVVATKKTQLGLDLQGGVQLVYEGKPTKAQPTVTQEALDRSLGLLRERVDALGVSVETELLGGRKRRNCFPSMGKRGIVSARKLLSMATPLRLQHLSNP
ncbi:MAG: hypothetical protein KY410_05315 [Proteobacteria bacterium]|nr:hypothetical protein [Pseudomonadota bacterium]